MIDDDKQNELLWKCANSEITGKFGQKQGEWGKNKIITDMVVDDGDNQQKKEDDEKAMQHDGAWIYHVYRAKTTYRSSSPVPSTFSMYSVTFRDAPIIYRHFHSQVHHQNQKRQRSTWIHWPVGNAIRTGERLRTMRIFIAKYYTRLNSGLLFMNETSSMYWTLKKNGTMETEPQARSFSAEFHRRTSLIKHKFDRNNNKTCFQYLRVRLPVQYLIESYFTPAFNGTDQLVKDLNFHTVNLGGSDLFAVSSERHSKIMTTVPQKFSSHRYKLPVDCKVWLIMKWTLRLGGL